MLSQKYRKIMLHVLYEYQDNTLSNLRYFIFTDRGIYHK